MKQVEEILLQMQDLGYRRFHSALMPTVPIEKIIGVRVPALRKFAKKFSQAEEKESFLSELPHRYYEEDNLHAFLIEQIADFDEAMKKTEEFLPYIDNWATCDMFFPKVFLKEPETVLERVYRWLASDKPYVVRYAIGILMRMFLGDRFSEEYPEIVCRVQTEHYYVRMMVAWYFATALAKQYPQIIRYFTENRLDALTHNLAIQKAVESNRISKETKEYLKMLRHKRVRSLLPK